MSFVSPYMRVCELEAFAKHVNKLRTEGMSSRDIARRLDVSVSAMNERLRKHRREKEGALHVDHRDQAQQP